MTKHRRRRLSNLFKRACRAERWSCTSESKYLRPLLEQLESRQLLAAEFLDADLPSESAWFVQSDSVQRLSLDSIANPIETNYQADVVGPHRPVMHEWIVQLKSEAVEGWLGNTTELSELLVSGDVQFDVVKGLGSRGLILVRSQATAKSFVEYRLADNPNVASFSLNTIVRSTAVPNDESFGSLINLQNLGQAGANTDADVDAPEAWGNNKGSTSIVVGVVDSGIDATHPDLFLNIWLNQGEIPSAFLDNVGPKLTDIDGDGLFTFYDLNNLRFTSSGYVIHSTGQVPTKTQLTTQTPFAIGPNAPFVRDVNGNGRIDAVDIIKDPNWAQGIDNDRNGFVDDFFGWNFGNPTKEPFDTNEPLDVNGHGTHVAGIIGAVGNNQTGIVGINWRTSLMALKFLDENNQGDTAAAIEAVNYATMMRTQRKADVQVLNNSWGEPSNANVALNGAIGAANEAGILFVAAAGNGNILGQSVDNDRTSYYPASFDQPNVISVTASDSQDRLAPSYNFGRVSVDLAAPGVGILSTYPNGQYGPRSGTSMAAPHVAGAAALVFAQYPDASLAEVKQAILSTVDPILGAELKIATGGRLNVDKAVRSGVFAPSARLDPTAPIVITKGAASTEFTVIYTDRDGLNPATVDNDDLIVTRQWGPSTVLPVTLKSKVSSGNRLTAVYELQAPGGPETAVGWDPLDFGEYVITTVAGRVDSISGRKTEAREIGRFSVKISDPFVYYVDSLADSLDAGTLRRAIQEINATSLPYSIILDKGVFPIRITPTVDPASTFGVSLKAKSNTDPGGWSNNLTGDFDILGNVTIYGDTNDETILDGQGLDRLFKVHPNGRLALNRVTLRNGVAFNEQNGGAILSLGNVVLNSVNVLQSEAVQATRFSTSVGGGLAAWGGSVSVSTSWFDRNIATIGGALFFGGNAQGQVTRTTLSQNQGGGVTSRSTGSVNIVNSTLSANDGGEGAVSNFGTMFGSYNPKISQDGRFVVFESLSGGLVAKATDTFTDIYVFDTIEGKLERVSVDDNGVGGDGNSSSAVISGNGRFVAFMSRAKNLKPALSPSDEQMFVYDRQTKTIKLVLDANVPAISSQNYSPGPLAVSNDGTFVAFSSGTFVSQGGIEDTDVYVKNMVTGVVQRVNQSATNAVTITRNPSMSSDGNWIAFDSSDPALQPNDTNARQDVFLFNRTSGQTTRLSVPSAGNLRLGDSIAPVISGNGNVIAFVSDASLVAADTDLRRDIYVYNRLTAGLSLLNVAAAFETHQGESSLALSDDGRYLAYLSEFSAPNFGLAREVVLHDFSTGQSQIVSSPSGVTANAGAFGIGISGDGRFVTFSSAANNITPQDQNGRDDIFVYDATQNTLAKLPLPGDRIGVLIVSQSTIARTANAFYTVTGDVRLDNTLFVDNLTRSVSRTAPSTFSFNKVLAETETSTVDSLKRSNGLPPVHRLLFGNSAINAGDPAKSGTIDQLGSVRSSPDVGSFEAVAADIQGNVFADFNRNGIRDATEPGIPNLEVLLTTTAVGPQDPVPSGALSATTSNSSSSREGDFQFTSLSPGSYIVTPMPTPLWKPSEASTTREVPGITGNSFDSLNVAYDLNRRRVAYVSNSQVYVYDTQTKQNRLVSANSSGQAGNSFSETPRISADGNVVAFISASTNFVSGDTSNRDVFVVDLNASSILRIPVIVNGSAVPGDASDLSISEDGRFVAFVWDKGLNFTSVYVYDRSTATLDMVSPTIDGQELTGRARRTSISRDGNIVAFHSTAGNLDSQDTTFFDDVFYFNRTTRQLTRVKSALASPNPNGNSSEPQVSGDGRFIVYSSTANNLVAGDDSIKDIFIYEIDTQNVNRINRSRPFPGTITESINPTISSDGSFVAFTSSLTNTNIARQDVYVWNRKTDTVVLASRTSDEGIPDSVSRSALISGDGRFIGFASLAANLVPGDTVGTYDAFVAFNPLVMYSKAASLRAGDLVTDFDIGLVPQAGSITGRVFIDTLLNGTFDDSERPIDRATVFLDANENGFVDIGERTTETGVDGLYRFDNIDALQRRVVALRAPAGFSIVSPGETSNARWVVVLAAGQSIVDRDFALRPSSAIGQSENSSVDGIAFLDNVRNGDYNAIGDTLLPNTVVFLDQAPFDGVWRNPERRTLTDAGGRYSFSGLGSQIVNVVAEIGTTAALISPKGSVFEKSSEKLFPTSLVPTQQTQAMVSTDFNGDTFPDLAVTISDGDRISIRLNDGNGGFSSRQIDLPLPSTGRGRGPIALQAGRFNNNTLTDLAVVNYFDGTVVVMLDFNGSDFASKTSITVGAGPIDIAAGNFNNDAFLDLAVVNSLSHTVSILLNNGSGGFTVGAPIASGGLQPIAIAVGHFNDDNGDSFNRDGDRLDIAVVNKNGQLATPGGGVSIFRGDGLGSFTLANKFSAGPNPVDIVVADFDLDAKATPDIAVNNQGAPDLLTRSFSADQINVFPGSTSGVFGNPSQAVGTTGGTIDLVAVDVENDGDIDLVSSNSINGDVSIFRNTKKQNVPTAPLRFEPSEVIGLARIPLTQRNPIAAVDVDNSGTTDIVVIALIDVPSSTGTSTIKTPGINVLKNRATSGVHRVSLDGTNTVSNLNFATFSTATRPSFNALSNPNPVPEDAGTQAISITGVTGATGLVFSAVSSNPSVVPNPNVSYAGGTNPATLSYQPVANAFGTAIITVRATNPGSGSTLDAGVFERSFTITVSPVNDRPTAAFPLGRTVTRNEDAGAQTVAGFVNGITVGGGAFEASQVLQPLTVTAANPSLFLVQPAIDATGRLTFTGAPNAAGTSIVTLTVRDNGGNADGGSDTLVEQFTITLTAINDAPSISHLGNRTVQRGAAAQTVNGFAFNFQRGGGTDEASQTIAGFSVVSDNPTLFAVAPAISTTGVLTFTPSATLTGTANVAVRVRDSGGTANGGVDLSSIQYFSITVVADAMVRTSIDVGSLGANGLTIFGAGASDWSGNTVRGVGDVNNDGYDDVIVGARQGDAFNNAKANAGESYLVFGSPTPLATIDLAVAGTSFVPIYGADAADQSGFSVSGAGDLNGDGFDDLLIGAPLSGASGNAKAFAGETYVLLGRATFPASIDLSVAGSASMILFGADVGDGSGRSVSAAGDVNGDGFDDLIIGADLGDAANNAKPDAGESYVYFGRTTLPATLDLASAAAFTGLRIFGADAGDRSGISVSGAGDVNNDGFDDLLIGAFTADALGNAKASSGDAYLVYGSASMPTTIDLANLGTLGVTFFGADAGDALGQSVSAAGDINGDGFDDILLGANTADALNNAKSNAGESYVVYGAAALPATINLASLGAFGIVLLGADANDAAGFSVGQAGDINADGFDDLVIGAYLADGASNLKSNSGESFVLFGGVGLASSIDLATVAAGSLKLLGADTGDVLGSSIGTAGDFNGDGFDDLILGAMFADSVANGRGDAGESYVVFGGNNFTLSATHLGTLNAEIINGAPNGNVIIAGRGNDFLVGNGGPDVLSGGQGNDTLAISDTGFRRINGGTGLDTLRIDGSNVVLNLTTIADNRIRDIELIDLTGTGNNTLALGRRDVLNLSSSSNLLTVRGNAGDRVELEPGWSRQADVVIGTETFQFYLSPGSIAALRILSTVTVQNTIDVGSLGSSGITILGVDPNDQSNFMVSNAGDVNRDGYDDLIIGAKFADGPANARLNGGDSYLIYGGLAMPRQIDLANLGTAGVVFQGIEAGDFSGWSVSTAGDLNGDGLSDLIIGAITAGALNNAKLAAGETYILLGSVSYPPVIDLGTLNNTTSVRLIPIYGADGNDFSGGSIRSGGDINGDGYDDLLIGAEFGDGLNNSKASAGESYVVFGAATLPASFNLAALGTGGIVLFGADADDRSGTAVSGAGDVNGDGYSDFLIGAPNADASGNSKSNAGEVYLVYGRPSFTTTIDLNTLGTSGVTISGADAGDLLGRSVAAAGDVNGDGLDDFIVGAPGAGALNNTKAAAGESYLIFGSTTLPSTLNLAGLGSNGLVLFGSDAGDASGTSVSGAGDINGDGFDDILLGAPNGDGRSNGRSNAGESYLVFGNTTLPATIDLSTFGTQVGTRGLVVYGTDIDDLLGTSVGGGDFNGDGYDDLLLGAPQADGTGNLKTNSGESYIVWGGNNFTFSTTHQGTPNPDTLTGTTAANIMNGGRVNDLIIGNGGADVLIGGNGNDTLAISDLNFRRIDGGRGNDTLRLDGSGLTLNLTTLRNNRIQGIQTIDITGSGNNTLIFNYLDALALTDEQSVLTVNRNNGDTVDRGTGWTQLANQIVSGITYEVFVQRGVALRIQDVSVAPSAFFAAEPEGGDTFMEEEFNPRQNPVDRHDVNGDGTVSPIDVLMVINALRRHGSGAATSRMIDNISTSESTSISSYIDVDGDRTLSPIDVLQIINRMNRRTGESEFSPVSDLDSADSPLARSYGRGAGGEGLTEALSNSLNTDQLFSDEAMVDLLVGSEIDARKRRPGFTLRN